ncbi:hypothetical protein TTHERM_00564110 (macronuclear) [Tetrahymena thermophila SB210]|uniref:Uncharacterized protein n=1 Tax=Tetrahymena thermophila (strain SB210) TaxID=312017 RepID=I7MGN7_TETTS|nr:hypothetical protein TTHERM_00564110 [Tetrahymena thermophila SB210]EAS01765.1 hypothetical protein TTHERM_00564110 [Tetrahymena thermophila SB210]|eukprot:XP_001022010.1 hypothetical protein TTHERM_00564110 [Tetrahymena thermophila SB210]
MFQKVNKTRPKLKGLFQDASKEQGQFNKIQMTNENQQGQRRQKHHDSSNSNLKQSNQNTQTNQQRQTSKSSEKQVNTSKESKSKDSVREEKDHTELRQSKMSQITLRKSDMSSHSRSVKDLSSLDYLRYKREQSRERGEYYDMGGGVYKNYKYEKLKLQRPEFCFLSSKPLDFFSKSLNSNPNKNCTENAIQSIKRQQDIVNIGMADIKNKSLLLETPVYQEIKQKMQSDILNCQERLYPFEEKQKIKKKLDQLDQFIKEKNNLSTSPSLILQTSINSNNARGDINFPSVQSAKVKDNFLNNENSQRLSQSQMSSQNIKNLESDKKWISPMIRYESLDTVKYKPNQNSISKTDIILKNELFQQGQQGIKQKKQSKYSSENLNRNENGDHDDQQNDAFCLNVINFNKAFKGKGQKMYCLLNTENHNPLKFKNMGDLIKSMNKKSQHLLIVEEFNRLLQLDRIQQAKKRTKKIKTKMDAKIDEQALFNQIITHDYCISSETFLQETFFFEKYIRTDGSIKDRVLYGISNKQNGIDFESYLRFYQIFVFQNTPPDVLIPFISKFFILNQESKFNCITVAQFQQTLKELTNHPQLLDSNECYEKWVKALQEQKIFTYDQNVLMRQKLVEQLLQDTINPNLILKLIFK